MARLLVLLLILAPGCGSTLEGCSPVIPDGTYSDSAGDAYTFVDGKPPGWSCIETAECPRSISCTPIGETVYTVEFVSLGDGAINATTSPPGVTVTLTAKGAP